MGNLTGIGYGGENFSVEREIQNILKDNKANKNYYVYVTDTAKPRLGNKDRIVHKVNTVVVLILELREKLIEMEMQDKGINPKARDCKMNCVS